MAQPTTYLRQYNFENYQAASPSDPLPGDEVDNEFNTVKQTLDEVLANLALIQRDDGELANGVVTRDSLSAEVTIGFEAPTTWVTGTAYSEGDTVFTSSSFYICETDHTSGTFAVDLAASKWVLIADFTGIALDIHGTTEVTIPANADEAIIYDDSVTAQRRITLASLFKVINTLTGETSLAADDRLPFYDTDEGAANSMSLYTLVSYILGLANSFTVAQTVALTAAGTALTLQATDDGVSAVSLVYNRVSASPAANDVLRVETVNGRDSAGNAATYADDQISITSAIDGAEEGLRSIRTLVAGALGPRLRIGAGVYHPSATGGDKGNNTINFGAVYVNDDAVATKAAANEFTAAQTFSTTSTATNVAILQCTNDDGLAGPYLSMRRVSASPEVNDLLAELRFDGRDSGGNTTKYASVSAMIVDPTDASEDGDLRLSAMVAGTSTTIMRLSNGVVVGAPTGSFKGAGTLNAVGVYDDNTLLTCYVFDAALDGAIDDAKWDAKVPDRHHPAVTEPTVNAKGEVTGERTVEPARVETRRHEDMRKFKARLGGPYDPLDIDKYTAHWREKRHLSSLPNEATFDPVAGLPAGAWVQRLVETVEIQAVHIANLHERLKAVGA